MSEIHFCKDCKHFNQFDATCKTVRLSYDKVTGEESRLPCVWIRDTEICSSYQKKIKPNTPPTTETIKRKSPLFGWIYNLLEG